MKYIGITLFCQTLPPDKQDFGGTEMVVQLARYLRERLPELVELALGTVGLDDDKFELTTELMMRDVVNYRAGDHRLSLGFVLPATWMRSQKELSPHLLRGLQSCLERDMPQVGDTRVLGNERGELFVPLTLGFANVLYARLISDD